jgi:hypothetical protein
MARSTLLPHRKVVQARALLMAADGMANQQIARRCEVDSDTVRRWRDRFVHGGPGGAGVIAKGRGRKPSLPAGTVAEVTVDGQRGRRAYRPANTGPTVTPRHFSTSTNMTATPRLRRARKN